MAIQSTSSLMAPISSPVITQRSPWHSPVPYLFGALAAMMGLIAFALLILACSYWKLSRNLRNEAADGDRRRDLEAAGSEDDVNKPNDNTKINQTVFEENYLVIMAGQDKPTFLATPATSSRTSSFGGSSLRSSSMTSEENSSASQREKDESSNRVQTSNLVSADLESTDQMT